MTHNQEDPMAAVPQQEPAKPAKTRPKAKWTVFVVKDTGLVEVAQYEARNADAACWLAAENQMSEEAMRSEGSRLVAIKASEIDPKTYRLRSTVERVRA